MKVLVTGARGQLATDLRTRLTASHEVVALAHAELDITDAPATRACLDRLHPDVVINTAAFHRVDDCESEVERAFAVNAFAVLELARWCAVHDSTLVHFSTDYVFSGREASPRAEWDTPGPLSVYGASKLAGEYLVRQACARHFVVRTCGLYGHAGSAGKGGNFIEKMLTLAATGKPIRVVDDQVLTPSFTEDVAEKVVQLIGTGQYGLYHVTNGGSCTWYAFTQQIFRTRGVRADLRATTTAEFAARARRPAFSVLRHAGLARLGIDDMPPWDDALRRYLAGPSAHDGRGDEMPRA